MEYKRNQPNSNRMKPPVSGAGLPTGWSPAPKGQLKMNGKELPKSSFEKYTAKLLVNKMKAGNDPAGPCLLSGTRLKNWFK